MASATKYEVLFEQANQLKSQRASGCYDRIKLMVKILASKEYVAAEQSIGRDPIDRIKDHFDDFPGFDFFDLRDMLEMFPSKQQWVSTPLKVMYLEYTRAAIAKRKNEKTPNQNNGDANVTTNEDSNQDETNFDKHPERRLSWKEKFIDLETRYKVLEERCKSQEKEIKRLNSLLKQRLEPQVA